MQEKLARGEVALCMATRLARTADIAMIADSCGFDAFYVDMEHCTISLDDTAQICIAALPVGVTPLVRIAGRQFDDAARLLDMGALGIICPNVSTRGEAEAFVRVFSSVSRRWANVRSAAPARCKAIVNTPLGEVNNQGNAATVLIAMLETPEGIANADAIAALPGIDVLLIGSNDLCTAMGIPGELKNPKLRAAYEIDRESLQSARQDPRRRGNPRRRRASGRAGEARRAFRDRRLGCAISDQICAPRSRGTQESDIEFRVRSAGPRPRSSSRSRGLPRA